MRAFGLGSFGPRQPDQVCIRLNMGRLLFEMRMAEAREARMPCC